MQASLTVDRRWDGAAARPDEVAHLRLRRGVSRLELEVEAPFHRDPAPAAPPGSTDRLWEHEVVELFLLGDDDAYLEVELGPWGHYLVLQLRGARQVEASGLAIPYHAERRGALWAGRAEVPAALLPAGLRAANAYAIHGEGAARRHLAAWPVPGEGPDFHRLEAFRPIPWSA